ncbi:MAG: type II toxin-antitoxin system RelE/ParE family toxin [Dehalococcoidia bacterium]|nr:type II toxin-antitoxin system RelE/ParE family toxin [Dehalococcoidia bacterium]
MSAWRLVYYRDSSGRYPVKEYVAKLDPGERAKVRFDFDLLKQFGVQLGAPYVRSLGGKLWELRTTGRSQHRIVYFAVAGRRLVLLHAFVKKTQKTPQAQIDTAMRRMGEYLETERRAEARQEHDRR